MVRLLFAVIAMFLSGAAFADVTIEFPEVKGRDIARHIEYIKQNFSTFLEQQNILGACDQLLASSKSEQTVRPAIKNGFIATLFEAYSTHNPLVIRPDDVWLAIGAAFGNYITTHSEEMRNVFVEHEGQKELHVVLKPGGSEFWTNMIEDFSQEVAKNVKGDIQKWLLPEFTTTTSNDKTVSRILCMGAMKEYFKYTGWLSCGLTKLTLTGTLEDWQNLRIKAARLAEFGGELEAWSQLLLPVLDQFIQVYQGHVDTDFWQRIVKHEALSSGGGGPWQIDGWAMVFAPFNAKGKYNLLPREQVEQTRKYSTVLDEDIPNAVVSVPVTLKTNNQPDQHVVFFGGITQPIYNTQDNSFYSNVGWAIIKKGEEQNKP